MAEQVDRVEVGAHPRRVDGLDDLVDVLRGVERGRDVALQGEQDACVLGPRYVGPT
jgi:hypothetical protein